MRFGIFYEHQLPRPWSEGLEHKLFQDALAQVELADALGFDYAWEVEHHFLEEYSHSSAPEVFLAACSQRTKQIRLGHGIVLMPPAYNHPARIAERIATLDLVSNGRVEWGTGESASRSELEGFGINPAERRAMWRETIEQTANMLAMDPYPG
ncbi:MAG TPA: LLM class flavin-dependent oxidoreductase, partial [Myxococcota bacterium]